MRLARWWVAIALVTLVGAATAARAQSGSPDDPAINDPRVGDVANPGVDGLDGSLADLAGDDAMGAGPGRAGMGRHGGRGGMPRGMARLENLDLSDSQRQKLADIREQHMKAGITGRANVELAELELRKLMRAERPDVGAVSRQVDKISDLRGVLMKNRLTGMLEARAVLTPEQLKKLREPPSHMRHPSPEGPGGGGQ